MNAATSEPRSGVFAPADPPSVMAMFALVSPVLVVTGVLLWFIAAEVAGFRFATFQDPATVSDALALSQPAAAVAMIRAGHDPNERSLVTTGQLGSHPVHVTSLQAAVLSRHPEYIALLLRHGARVDESQRLPCLVRAVGVSKDIPPGTIGVLDALPDDDVPAGGIEALERCGLSSD